jgi:hypothetical protein
MAGACKIAQDAIDIAQQAPQLRRFEQIVVDVDALMEAEAGHLGMDEIHSWHWRLMLQPNVDRIQQGKDHIFVQLNLSSGSAHKLQLHSIKDLDGKEYRFYLHHDVEMPGVMVREIAAGDKLLVILPELCAGDTLAVGVLSALSGEPCMEAVSFSALERVKVSQVIGKIRDGLMRMGFSQFTAIKVFITGGNAPLSSNKLIWDPRTMSSPIGAVGPIRRRTSGKVAAQTLEPYFKARQK